MPGPSRPSPASTGRPLLTPRTPLRTAIGRVRVVTTTSTPRQLPGRTHAASAPLGNGPCSSVPRMTLTAAGASVDPLLSDQVDDDEPVEFYDREVRDADTGNRDDDADTGGSSFDSGTQVAVTQADWLEAAPTLRTPEHVQLTRTAPSPGPAARAGRQRADGRHRDCHCHRATATTVPARRRHRPGPAAGPGPGFARSLASCGRSTRGRSSRSRSSSSSPMGVVLLTAAVLLWNLAQSTGTLDNVEGFFREAFNYDTFKLQADPLFHAALVLTVLFVVAGTGPGGRDGGALQPDRRPHRRHPGDGAGAGGRRPGRSSRSPASPPSPGRDSTTHRRRPHRLHRPCSVEAPNGHG